jgi:hypothetical protein
MAVCPTCGRPGYEPARKIVTADDLIAAMRQLGKDHKSRDVYRGGRGYWLTYGHEAVARNAVYEALRRGLIAPTYPHIEDGYWSLPDRAAERHREWEELEAKRAARQKASHKGRVMMTRKADAT